MALFCGKCGYRCCALPIALYELWFYLHQLYNKKRQRVWEEGNGLLKGLTTGTAPTNLLDKGCNQIYLCFVILTNQHTK